MGMPQSICVYSFATNSYTPAAPPVLKYQNFGLLVLLVLVVSDQCGPIAKNAAQFLLWKVLKNFYTDRLLSPQLLFRPLSLLLSSCSL